MRVNVSVGSGPSTPPMHPREAPAGRSKLQLQCANGQVLDVSHEEAMMSSTLWTLLQDVTVKRAAKRSAGGTPARHMLPVFDVPSDTVELALDYCRCLYQQQVERADTSMRIWEEQFFELDSKTLCDLAKVASNLDIQPLVDLTCRSIAQIMSATEAADELRQKFGLDDPPPPHDATCNCQMRGDVAAGFDFDVLNALDHDISTDEYEFVELEQPSVDELVDFINGDADHPSGSGGGAKARHAKKNGGSVDTASDAGNEGGAAGGKKKKRKKKKSKKASTSSSPNTASASKSRQASEQGEDDEEDDAAADVRTTGSDRDDDSSNSSSDEDARAATLQEKMRLARQNPSAVFLESQFEDDDDEELDEQLESFRRALESAYVDSRRTNARKPRLEFAPRDVFRSISSSSSTCAATASTV